MGKRIKICVRVIPIRNRIEYAYVNKKWEGIVSTIEWMNNPINHICYMKGEPMVELTTIRRKLKRVEVNDWNRIDEISKWLKRIEDSYSQIANRIIRPKAIRHAHIRKACKRMDDSIWKKRKKKQNLEIVRKKVANLQLPENHNLGLSCTPHELLSNLKLKKDGLQRECTEPIK